MERILNDYYELTVIPAIVLGCVTALIHPMFNYMVVGVSNFPSIGEAIGVTILFLVPMTVEHGWEFLHEVG
jgi:hypothetical protein